MTENRKPFDQKLFDENDTPAGQRLQELFARSKYTVRRSANKYGVDFEVLKDGQLWAYLEVEVKKGWSAEEYPFPDVRFPKRKEKFTKLDKPTYFVMFNKTLSRHLMVPAKTLVTSPTEKVNNKYLSNEEFYVVALQHVKWDRFKRLESTDSA